MDMKRIARFYIAAIIIAIGFITVFPQGVIATDLYNQDFLFSGGGSGALSSGRTELTNSGGFVYAVALTALHIDFTTYKQYTLIYLNPGLSYLGGWNKAGATLNGAATGIVTKATRVTATIGGVFYASGSIGWQRNPATIGSTNWIYFIYFDSINSSLANAQTGVQTVILAYNTSVYSDYINNFAFNAASDFVASGGEIHGATTNGNLYSTSGSFAYTFQSLEHVIFTSVTNTFGYINITKYNNSNFRNNLSITNDGVIFDTTSTTNISEYVNYTAGLTLKIQDIASGGWANVTIVESQFVPPVIIVNPVSGTIAFNQTAYAKTATVNFSTSIISNYNASKAYYFKLFKFETTELVGVSGVNPAIINTFHADPNIFIDYKGRIKVYLYEDTTVLSFATAYYGSTQTTPNGTTGNFTIHNSIPILKTLPAVFQEQNINITYNLSTDGFLKLVKGSTTWTYDLDAGTRVNQLLYVPTDMVTGDYIAHLMYYDIFTFQDTTLQSKGISILPIQNISLSCDKSTYLQGETIRCNGYLNESGYAAITFPPSKKTSKNLSGADIFNINLVTNENSETGTYFVTVVGVSGTTLVVQVQLIRNVIATPTIPIDPNVTAPLSITCTGDSVLDATACLSEQILGLNPSSDGSYSDIEMKNTGNKLFSTLLLLCLVLLGVGIYKKFTESNKRK